MIFEYEGNDNLEAKYLYAEYPVRDFGYEYATGYAESMKYLAEHWEDIKFLKLSRWGEAYAFYISFDKLYRLAIDNNTPLHISGVLRKIAEDDIGLVRCERCGCYTYTLVSYRGISGIYGRVLECIPCINRANGIVLKAKELLRTKGSDDAILHVSSGLFNCILAVGNPVYICGLKPTGYKHKSGRKQRGNRGVPIVKYQSNQIGVIESVTSDTAVCRLSDGSGTIEYPRCLPVISNFEEFTDTLFLSFTTNHKDWGIFISERAMDALRMKEFKKAYEADGIPEILRVAGIRYNKHRDVLPHKSDYVRQEKWHRELTERIEKKDKDRLPYYDPYERYRKRFARMTPEEKAVAESSWGDREEWQYIISSEPTPYEVIHGAENELLWVT